MAINLVPRKPVFNNILNRDFTTTAINQKWCDDITYFHTNEGWIHVAIMINGYSRAVISWLMDKWMSQALVCNLLLMIRFYMYEG